VGGCLQRRCDEPAGVPLRTAGNGEALVQHIEGGSSSGHKATEMPLLAPPPPPLMLTHRLCATWHHDPGAAPRSKMTGGATAASSLKRSSISMSL
jgi:hypothetical protein